ncbi:MAG: acyl-CoA desaturase, partial [Candidatus Thermoplasmatota archaeon]
MPGAAATHDPFPFHKDSTGHKAIVVAALILPALAAVYAIASPGLGLGPSRADIALLLGMWTFTGLGISVGFHRMLTHKAVTMRAPTRLILLIAGSMALQGPAADWAATHTRHHSRSDRNGDPHSPQDGFWHAHFLWLLRDRFVRNGLAHDKLMTDPIVRFVTRTWWVWAGLGLVAPAAIGYAISGTALGALNGFVWGGQLRVFIGHHITWTVNSLGHKFGTRPYESADQSTNNWIVAFLG